jgi:hypothetical protein
MKLIGFALSAFMAVAGIGQAVNASLFDTRADVERRPAFWAGGGNATPVDPADAAYWSDSSGKPIWPLPSPTQTTGFLKQSTPHRLLPSRLRVARRYRSRGKAFRKLLFAGQPGFYRYTAQNPSFCALEKTSAGSKGKSCK